MNKLLAFGIVGGLLLLGNRVFGASRIGQKAVVKLLNPRIHKVDAQGILFRTEIGVENPTNTVVSMTGPVVKITSAGQFLASSVPKSKSYEIKGLDRTVIDTIEIPIPWTSLSSYLVNLIGQIPALLATYRQTGKLNLADLPVPLEMSYSLYINDLFFESTPQKIA